MSSEYRIDLHILDHAETVKNSIENYNPQVHKSHFKCSIDTSQLIVAGFNNEEKINDVMNKILDEIINTKYTYEVKTRTYTDKQGNKKEYFSKKSFSLNENTLAAYHNRAFNSEIAFDNIEPHFHFLFDSKHTGKNYHQLKKHLQNVASKYNLVFHFNEEKDRSNKKYKGLMEKCSRFSWFIQKMTNKQLINYVDNKEDLDKNLELLYDYTKATGNTQFYIKAMNSLNRRLEELNLNYTWKEKNLKNYPIPIDDITNQTLISIAKKDIKNLKSLMNRDNFLARDYIKYINGFQSTIIEEFKKRGYKFPKIPLKDFDLEKMKGKKKVYNKESINENYTTFNKAVKDDISEALKYAKNEKDFKDILSKFGYENISFRNQNINGKRKKTAIKFTINDKSYSVYFNQLDLDYSFILHNLQINSKNNVKDFNLSYESKIKEIKFFNSYQNKIFKDIYNIESDVDLSKYYIEKENNNSIKITNKDTEIIDNIDELISNDNITDDEARLIVQLLKKKGWVDINKLNFNDSSKEFTKKIKDAFERDI